MFNYFVGIVEGAGLSGGEAVFYYSVAGIVDAVSLIIWGLASDYIGRRRRLGIVIADVGSVIMAVPSFYLLYLDAYTRNISLL